MLSRSESGLAPILPINRGLDTTHLGVNEKVQPVSCLLCKHEDLSLLLQNACNTGWMDFCSSLARQAS